MKTPNFLKKPLTGLALLAAGIAGAPNADAALTKTINIDKDVLLPGPLVGITTTDDKIYASGTGGAAVDSGKDLTFETTVGNASSVQDTGNWNKNGINYALDLQNGDLEIYNRSNEFDNASFGVASAYKGVGDAFSLNGSDYAPLVKSLGNNDYRLDLLNLLNGSITTTDLAFNSTSSITGLGNGTGSSLASMPFLFTTDNQTILEGGVGKGIVAEYMLGRDYGNLTDVAIDGSNMYLAGDDFGGRAGRVMVSEDYTPIVPEPGTLGLAATGILTYLSRRKRD